MTTGTAGSVLRVAREASGLSRRDLAASAGVCASYLAQVERGERVASQAWEYDVIEALVTSWTA